MREVPDLRWLEPKVVTETERLLSKRIRHGRLHDLLLELYLKSSWKSRAPIIRAWMVWAIIISLIFCTYAPLTLGMSLQSAIVAPVGITFLSLVGLAVWRKPRSSRVEGLSVVAATLGLQVIYSSIGHSIGGFDAERFGVGALFIVVIGVTILRISLPWTFAIAIGGIAIFAVQRMTDPLNDISHEIAVISFYALGMGSAMVARSSAVLLDQRSFLLLLRDVHRRKALADTNAQLEVLAKTDALTGLANRRYAATHVERVFREATPDARKSFVFLMIDIDHFKWVNDTWGHSQGDDCIRRVGEVIEAGLRKGDDLVSRHGGEEFLVLLTMVSDVEAQAIAERIRSDVIGLSLPNPKAEPMGFVTVSIGVAPVGGHEDAGAAIVRADKALYAAKASGRNRVGLSSVEADAAGLVPHQAA